MKKYILFIAMSFSILSCVNLFANDSVSISHGKYSDYYHIKYTLVKTNFQIQEGTDPAYNGQFEILLNKQKFPIPAKNCKDKLILRMPATLSDSKNRTESINIKILLFKEIQDIYYDKKENLDIIIELNPYVTVLSKKPLKLEIENCNIFFRTKNNMYINHLK